MDTYTIIEDVFENDNAQNQITAARGFVGQPHVPEDLRSTGRNNTGRVGSKVSERPDFQDLDPRRMAPPPMNIPQRPSGGTMSPMMNALTQGPSVYPGVDSLACRDVFTHVENCPLCKSYFRHDAKFYWMIIAILIAIILLITRNSK